MIPRKMPENDGEPRYPWKMEQLTDYGSLIEIDEFLECVDAGGFIDYDGHGYLALHDLQSDIMVSPSTIKRAHEIYPEFTHVMWYNR